MKRAILLTVAVTSLTLAPPSPPAGAAVLTGGPGDDVVFGGPDADRLSGGEGSDILFGKSGRGGDRIVGDGGGDTADGGAGRDDVEAELVFDDDGENGDSISGGLVFAADGGRDVIECTFAGSMAFVDSDDRTEGCTIRVTHSAGMIQSVPGGSIFIPVYGTDGTDAIHADAGVLIGSVLVFGRGGDDSITLLRSGFALGGGGVDTVEGSDSWDTLVDGDGAPGDVLNGGGGPDRIFAADGAAGVVDCGSGDGQIDTVFVDPEDLVTNCDQQDEVRSGTETVVQR